MDVRFCPHCMHAIRGIERYCPHCGLLVEDQNEPYQLPVGAVLDGGSTSTYVMGTTLGAGGFGQTYVARDLDSGQVVAIKEYFPLRCNPSRSADGSVSPEPSLAETYQGGMRSFLSEATMLTAVRGLRGVVNVLDYFEALGTAYMVMEYLEGHTLRSLMETQTRFEPTLLLNKMLPLMRDIHTLHEAGVIHRDIAPDNILLMPDGTLRLIDFGCARSMEDGKSMTVMLKPGFAPPEQYFRHGQRPYTDVYALCATIYYCLVGRVPDDSPERAVAMAGGVPDPLSRPSELGVNLAPEVEQVLMRGLSLDVDERPQTMGELADQLEELLRPHTEPTRVPPLSPDPPRPVPSPGEHTSSQPGSLKVYLVLAIVVIALLLVIVLLLALR